MQIVPLYPESRIQLKKPHPCGNRVFRVARIGSEVRIICTGCGRDLTLDRVKLEKSVRKIISATTSDT